MKKLLSLFSELLLCPMLSLVLREGEGRSGSEKGFSLWETQKR
jgi:hypothetical protein